MVQCRPELDALPSECLEAVSLAHHMSQTALPVELQEDVNTHRLAIRIWDLPAGLTFKRQPGSWDIRILDVSSFFFYQMCFDLLMLFLALD